MDMENVLQEGPWLVSGNLLVLEKWNSEQRWSFQRCEFWIQLHDLPLELQEVEVIQKVAKKVGDPRKIMRINGFQFGAKVSYMRVRVDLDVHRPLRTTINIKRSNGVSIPVTIRYEKLPLFCYYCATMGHDDKRCTTKFEDDEKHRSEHGCTVSNTCPELPPPRCGPEIQGISPDESPRGAMEVLSWNCQGLGNPRAVRTLKHVSKSETPDMMFLIETKSNGERLWTLKRRMKYHEVYAINAVGASGGLALFWHQNIKVKIMFADARVIDCEVSSEQGNKFFLTCVYGDPVKSQRQGIWNRIASFGMNKVDQWLCIGDFNSFLSWHEKVGGVKPGSQDMNQLREFLNNCNLMDIGAKGPVFTWNNKRSGSANIRIKLNRALANLAWRMKFENAITFVRPTIGSDHNPLLVDTNGGKSSGSRPFHFEAMWIRHPRCKQVISSSWTLSPSNPNDHFWIQKTGNCREALRKWNYEDFDHVQARIKELKQHLEIIQSLWPTAHCQDRENAILSELEEMPTREEILWHQKARMDWINWGDSNFAFFHASTIQRRHHNRIIKLKKHDEAWTRSKDEVFSVLHTHFCEVV
ncbi:uncharacterized protein LOC122658959 [Telopea speciosissima]|uniref:uncharacterized protein LOC122658959 n=1 Tax=Telopea speciosissima TaxID=54955 RepID=UPI001CC7F6F3|nr:uncharacterized protein LOC122658959 [Telopea speciosissima]